MMMMMMMRMRRRTVNVPEAEFSADDHCVDIAEAVVTHCAPSPVHTHLQSSFALAAASHQPQTCNKSLQYAKPQAASQLPLANKVENIDRGHAQVLSSPKVPLQ